MPEHKHNDNTGGAPPNTRPAGARAPANAARAHRHETGTAGWSFGRLARCVALASGSPWTTLVAVLTVVAWAVTGPVFGYSEQWQLVINTGTTIITFLMVFLIQHTQNRDSTELHMKLDELILSTRTARNEFIALDELSDTQLREFQSELRELADRYGAPGLELRVRPDPPGGGGDASKARRKRNRGAAQAET